MQEGLCFRGEGGCDEISSRCHQSGCPAPPRAQRVDWPEAGDSHSSVDLSVQSGGHQTVSVEVAEELEGLCNRQTIITVDGGILVATLLFPVLLYSCRHKCVPETIWASWAWGQKQPMLDPGKWVSCQEPWAHLEHSTPPSPSHMFQGPAISCYLAHGTVHPRQRQHLL